MPGERTGGRIVQAKPIDSPELTLAEIWANAIVDLRRLADKERFVESRAHGTPGSSLNAVYGAFTVERLVHRFSTTVENSWTRFRVRVSSSWITALTVR